MAPGFYLDTSTRISFVSTTFASTVTSSDYYEYQSEKKKEETKKAKKDRVSKMLMHSSWDLHNKKTDKIKDVKRLCKPQHRVLNKHYI